MLEASTLTDVGLGVRGHGQRRGHGITLSAVTIQRLWWRIARR